MIAEVNTRAEPLGWVRDWEIGKPTPAKEYHERFLRRFWAKVDKNGPIMRKGLTRCWVWTGSQCGGYGQIGHRDFYRDSHPVRAHVAAWCLVYGRERPSEGQQICHECNNKGCVREDHLWVGTPAENVHHAQATGLMPKVDWEQRERERLGLLNRQARTERGFIDRHLHLIADKDGGHFDTAVRIRLRKLSNT